MESEMKSTKYKEVTTFGQSSGLEREINRHDVHVQELREDGAAEIVNDQMRLESALSSDASEKVEKC